MPSVKKSKQPINFRFGVIGGGVSGRGRQSFAVITEAESSSRPRTYGNKSTRDTSFGKQQPRSASSSAALAEVDSIASLKNLDVNLIFSDNIPLEEGYKYGEFKKQFVPEMGAYIGTEWRPHTWKFLLRYCGGVPGRFPATKPLSGIFKWNNTDSATTFEDDNGAIRIYDVVDTVNKIKVYDDSSSASPKATAEQMRVKELYVNITKMANDAFKMQKVADAFEPEKSASSVEKLNTDSYDISVKLEAEMVKNNTPRIIDRFAPGLMDANGWIDLTNPEVFGSAYELRTFTFLIFESSDSNTPIGLGTFDLLDTTTSVVKKTKKPANWWEAKTDENDVQTALKEYYRSKAFKSGGASLDTSLPVKQMVLNNFTQFDDGYVFAVRYGLCVGLIGNRFSFLFPGMKPFVSAQPDYDTGLEALKKIKETTATKHLNYGKNDIRVKIQDSESIKYAGRSKAPARATSRTTKPKPKPKPKAPSRAKLSPPIAPMASRKSTVSSRTKKTKKRAAVVY